MLTIQSVISEVTAMEHALTEMGYYAVDADLNLHWADHVPVQLLLAYSPNTEMRPRFTAREETDEAVSAVIAEAWAHIRAMPSVEEAKRRTFLHNLGRVIDEGREIGFETEFLNPLEESMRKLSENILEDRS